MYFFSSEDFLKMADLVVTIARRKKKSKSNKEQQGFQSNEFDMAENNLGKLEASEKGPAKLEMF